MCMFCAAIPAAAATGAALNKKQLQAGRQAKAEGAQESTAKPIARVTADVVVLLLIGSLTYHTFTSLPY